MSDEPPDVEEVDLAEWPEALDAYRRAYELARRDAAERPDRKDGDADPGRELARLWSRLQLRGLDSAAEARVRMALDWGQADGTAGAEPRW